MKKGHLVQRGKGWRLKYDLPADGSGQRQTRYVTLRGCTTKREAEWEAARIIATIVSGTHVDPSVETVAQFVDRWLRDWALNNVSNQTWAGYAQMLRKHLCSRVGSVPIQKLRASDLQGVYAAMGRDGLADRTRLHLHRIVHVTLKHACQWGVVPRNVADMLDAPRVRAREIEILSPDQVQTALEASRGQPLYTIAVVAAATGLRRGELLALRWQDIDLDGGVLRVEQALEETTRSGLVFKAPKTRHGRRTVTLPPSTVALLRDHWKGQQEQRLALGLGRIEPSSLMFADWDGSARSPRALTQHWRNAMEKAGLTVTFHSLRHTHASTLIAEGVDVMRVSRRLGHGSPAITLAVYGHLFKSDDDRAAAIMEKALKGMK